MTDSDVFFKDTDVVITGAGGFIGKHLLKRLQVSGARITILSRKRAALPSEIRQYTGDIGNKGIVEDCISESKPDYIFHLAAFKERSIPVESLYTSVQTNLIGSLNIFSAAMSVGTVQSIVTLGTAEEYGNNPQRLCENSRESPATPYSYSKLCVSHLSELFWHLYELPVTVIRPSLAYGPGQGTEMFLPALITSLHENRPFKMTPGEQFRDFVYVDDLVTAVLLTPQKPRSYGQIINIGSGVPVKIADLALQLEKILGKTGLVLLGEIPYRKNEVMKYDLDLGKSREILRWKTEVSLEEGLRRTISYYCDGVQGI